MFATRLICARFLEDVVDPLSGYDSGLGAGVPHVAALALAPDPLDAGLGDRVGKNESVNSDLMSQLLLQSTHINSSQKF